MKWEQLLSEKRTRGNGAKARHVKSTDLRSEFEKDIDTLTLNAITSLRDDVHHFTKMFDYRNSGEDADFGNSRDSIERTIKYLTTRMPGEK